jgi:putative DNA primase/helicase
VTPDEAPRLTADARLEDVDHYLRALHDEVGDLDPIARATAREQAVRDLSDVEAVSAPAKMVNAALNGNGTKHGSDDLQGDVLALEDPEPWPESVDGASLLHELEEIFTRFLALPDGAAPALALWTLHAHAHDASPVSPVLALTSPEKRCGKTTLLELLSALVPRPLPASNVTAATVFRAVERWEPTLLVDEADTFIHEGSELKGILNSGHRRSLAYVVRTVGDDHEARTFQTWAPKAIALIGELPDTLADRSVEVRMRRRAPDEEVDRLRLDRLEELEPLRRRAWTWARDHVEELADADPDLPEALHDRQRDNWRPLVAIADAARGPWPKRARQAAETLTSDRGDDRSLGTRLLADVRTILRDHDSDRIRSKALVRELCDIEEAPWSEYKGRGLSPVSLANFLRSFDVSSKKLRFPSGPYKGYEVGAFEDAFRRYLPSPSQPPPAKEEHPEQSHSDKGPDGFSRRNTGDDVPGREPHERPDTTGDVPAVPGHEGDPVEGDPPIDDLPF